MQKLPSVGEFHGALPGATLASLPRPKGRSKALGLIARRAPTHGPNGGVADSLDEAKAAFRAAWEAHR
jgi:hypothetical protein